MIPQLNRLKLYFPRILDKWVKELRILGLWGFGFWGSFGVSDFGDLRGLGFLGIFGLWDLGFPGSAFGDFWGLRVLTREVVALIHSRQLPEAKSPSRKNLGFGSLRRLE